MAEDYRASLAKHIGKVSSNFEQKPWTENIRLLKEDFDLKSLKSPKHYSLIVDEVEEVLRQVRLLFVYSLLDKLCKEEGKLYYFLTPFQASLRYDAVMRKEGGFYLLDEDGDFRETFTDENFMKFIDELYWELYKEE